MALLSSVLLIVILNMLTYTKSPIEKFLMSLLLFTKFDKNPLQKKYSLDIYYCEMISQYFLLPDLQCSCLVIVMNVGGKINPNADSLKSINPLQF